MNTVVMALTSDPVCNECGCRKPIACKPCPCMNEEKEGVCCECQTVHSVYLRRGQWVMDHHNGPHGQPCNGIGTVPQTMNIS